MDFLSKYAKARDAETAVDNLAKQYAGFPVSSLLYFASSTYDGDRVSALMRDAFPGAVTFGCSSCGEITAQGLHEGSISAMAFAPAADETVAVAVAENIAEDPLALEKAFSRLEKQLGARLMNLDFHKHFGITLFDGRTFEIESFLERIGNLSDIIFIGGYASDDFKFNAVRTFFDGKSHEGAAILAVVRPGGNFRLLKTQSACPTGRSFLVTGADEATKTLRTLDGKPALEAYAEALGMRVSDLTPEVFLYNPFALMAEGQPFVRTVSHALDNGCMRLFCAVKEGMRLGLMRPSDIVEATEKDLANVKRDLGPIRAIIDFDCAHRAMILGEAGRYDKYATLFTGVEAAGFSTFGEAYIGFVNQTAVMALFA